MTPTDQTEPGQTETLAFVFELNHPPAKVWRALTDPGLLAEWLLPTIGFKLEPGTAFTFNAPPQPGWDGVVNCRVVDIEPHRKLTYAWVVGDMDTAVTFTLVPTEEGAGTRLSLVHSGFQPDQRQNFAGARYGWRMMGGRLGEVLARAT